MPNDRKTALVLADGDRGCEATAASVFNVKKNGKAFWEVKCYSATAKRVDIVFSAAPAPVSGSLTSYRPAHGRKWPDIKGDVVGAAGTTYWYDIKVDGVVVVDPELEIDP